MKLRRAGTGFGALACMMGLLSVVPGCDRPPPEPAAAAPVGPDLTGAPAELRRRVAGATARLRQNPDDRAALEELARLYHANGYTRPALEGYRRLQAMEPDEPRWPYFRGLLHAGFGEFEAAEPLLRRAVELAPTHAPAWLKLADLCLKTNRAAEADAAYRQALVIDPESPWAGHGRARLAAEEGRWLEARRLLERVVARHPEFFAANSLLTTAYERLGETEAAAVARQRARDADRYREPRDPWLDALADDVCDVYLLHVMAAASGEVAWSRMLLERALQLAPEDPRTLRQLGRLEHRAGNLTRAREHFERAISLAPAEPGTYLDAVAVYQEQDDREGARQLLRHGLAQAPDFAGLHFEMGLLEAAESDHAAAAQHLQRARELAPENLAAYPELATQLFRLGRVGEGRAVLEAALARDAGHAPSLVLLALYHVLHGQPEPARQLLERAERAGAPPAELEPVRLEYAARFGRAPGS